MERHRSFTALACSEPPQVHAHSSQKLLVTHVEELGIVEAASDTTIYRMLKKSDVKPHYIRYRMIPPKPNTALVVTMENVLDVYTRPHDPTRPLVCLDETSKKLIRDVARTFARRFGVRGAG